MFLSFFYDRIKDKLQNHAGRERSFLLYILIIVSYSGRKRKKGKEETDLLKDMTIRSLANDSAYERGIRYYRQGRVQSLQEEDGEPGHYHAVVRGSGGAYDTEILLSRSGDDVEDYCCSCPAAEIYLGACKHVVAALKTIQDDQREKSGRLQKDGGSPAGSRLLRLFGAEAKKAQIKDIFVHLVPRLFVSHEYGSTVRWLEFRIGIDKLYVVRALREFLEEAQEGQKVTFGKSLTVDTRRMGFADAISSALWQMLQAALANERDLLSYSETFHTRFDYRRTSYLFEQKRFKLTPSDFQRFLEIMGDASFEMRLDDSEIEDVRVKHGRPALRLVVDDKKKKGADLYLENPSLAALDDEGRVFYEDGTIYLPDEEFIEAARPLFEAFEMSRHIHLSPQEMEPFFRQVMPAVDEVAEVKVASSFLEKFHLAPLHTDLYLDYHGDGIEVRPVFSYEEARFNPLVQPGPPQEGDRVLVRNDRAEHEIENYFQTYDFHVEGQTYVQEDEARSYDFLTEALPALSEKPDVDVYYADAFQRKPVQAMPKVTAGVSVSGDNLLEVTFSSKDIDFDEIMDILSSYRQKRRYHRLKDGTFVTLGEQQLGALADFAESTGLRKGRKVSADGEEKVELPLSQAMYLDALAREEEGLRLERSRSFRHIVRDIRSPQDADVDVELPASLQGVLRDYQVTGFNWLCSLAHYHLGGILADDMGLGKTLQVIAFLLAHQDASAPPSLVVAPTSLVYNWLDEIEKFAPALCAKVIAGTKKERGALLEAAGTECDVLITTYNLLKRDIKSYEKRHFRYVFLDEAQHIKNPATQNAKAVKHLHAGDCFALTGTPIENTLTELWSIFDYLMPGYLLSHQSFKARYEIPIVREQDPRALKKLRQHVSPFILRRLKKDVLKELPDKVERRMVNEMTPQQAKVYQAYFLQGRKEFRQLLAEHGLDSGRIQILAILTRLRQICCDPSLFLEDYSGGSGKLSQLEEVVSEAVEGGHRLLIFSQFTTMLAHIGQRLRKLHIAYFYLDGSTPSLERLRLVKEFNKGESGVPVFLISLKAGGTGLNLTGADMVIHYDPWWNPAVEDQATDRAYRLGQQNNVQVLKFITKDTIEEKIYQLQQQKKSLIDKMIQPGESFLSKLTDEELAALFEK